MRLFVYKFQIQAKVDITNITYNTISKFWDAYLCWFLYLDLYVYTE